MTEEPTRSLTTDGRVERRLVRSDERFERSLFWRQFAIVVLVAILIALLLLLG
jgi:hypothetical protein